MRSAYVKNVISADLIHLSLAPDGSEDKVVHIKGLKAPKVGNLNHLEDEPAAWDVKEAVRQRLVGKTVQIEMHEEIQGRLQVSMVLDGQDVAALLISEGWAEFFVSPGEKYPENHLDLEELNQRAKTSEIGIYSPELTTRNMKSVIGDVNGVKQFFEQNQNKSIVGVIEHVRDGASFRAYFVDQCTIVQCIISGIQAPSWRRAAGSSSGEVVADPFAKESKLFTEMRLLGRRIPIRIDGATYANLLVTPQHPMGNFGEFILQAGLASLNDSTGRFLPEAYKLKMAQQAAQKQKKNIWHNFTPASTAEAGNAQSAMDYKEAMDHKDSPMKNVDKSYKLEKEYFARVLEIHSGDCLSLVPLKTEPKGSKTADDDSPKGAQETTVFDVVNSERRVYLASVRCPRPRTRTRQPEAWAQEAHKALIDMLAGKKKVRVVLDYTRSPAAGQPGQGGELPPASDDFGRMHFVTIYPKPKNPVNVKLVSQGLARVIRHRLDEDRSEAYEELVLAEREAEEKKLGIFSLGDPPKIRLNDLVGAQNTNKARALEASFKREGLINATIDHIQNGARFRLTLLEPHNAMITFILVGSRAPAPPRVQPNGVSVEGQPFAQEAIAFSRLNFLHRKVLVEILACDRVGSFIGHMYLNTTTPAPASSASRPKKAAASRANQMDSEKLVNCMVLRAGFARTDPVGLRQSRHADAMVAAEQEAVEDRLGMWALPELVDQYHEERGRRADETTTVASSPGGDISGQASLAVSALSALPKVSELLSVVVTHVVSTDSFFVRSSDKSELEEISLLCQQHGDSAEDQISQSFTVQRPPSVGDVILARRLVDQTWHRGSVLAMSGSGLSVHLLYVDEGTNETVSIDRCVRCPASLNILLKPPLATQLALAWAKPITDSQKSSKEVLLNLIQDERFDVNLVGRRHAIGSGWPAILRFCSDVNGPTLNEKMLATGTVKVHKVPEQQVSNDLRAKFEAMEKEAREERRGMWFYGDVGDSDDDDDMPVLRR